MNITVAILSIIIAFLVSSCIYPIVIRFAKKHNIVDNPNARKLQREPIPVLGGVTVFLGIAASLLFTAHYMDWFTLYGIIAFMFIMLIVGLSDDMFNLSATLRFCLEILLVWGYIIISHSSIECFHGLWGKHIVSPFLSVTKLPSSRTFAVFVVS